MTSIYNYNRIAASAVALLLVVLIGYRAAGLTWGVVYPPDADSTPGAMAPPPPLSSQPRGEYRRISALHLFGEPDRKTGAGSDAPVAAPKTQLRLFLHGILLADHPQGRIAIIADEQGLDRPYRMGDTVAGAARISEIQSQRVLLERAGRLEALELPKVRVDLGEGGSAGGTVADDDGALRIDRQLATNFSEMGRHLRFEPVREGGRLKGYRLEARDDDRMMQRIGLAAGDVVTRVNDLPVSEPNGLAELVRQLEERDLFVVEVENNGRMRRVNVRLD